MNICKQRGCGVIRRVFCLVCKYEDINNRLSELDEKEAIGETYRG